MNAKDAINEALAGFMRIPSIVERNRIPGIERVESNFDRVERNRREAKEERKRREYLGPDSLTNGDDDDWS